MTPTLDCLTVVNDLWDYLDGELDAVRWNAIRYHLATCTGCREHVDFCRAFLARAADAPVADDEVASLRARILVALHPEGGDDAP